MVINENAGATPAGAADGFMLGVISEAFRAAATGIGAPGREGSCLPSRHFNLLSRRSWWGIHPSNSTVGSSDPDAIAAFRATFAAVLCNGWIVEDDQLSTADWAMMASTLANGRADSRSRVRDDRMSEQFL